MSLQIVERAIPTQAPTPVLGDVRDYLVNKVYPCVRQLRELYNLFAQAANDGSFDIGGVKLRVGSGAPTATDPDGSVYFQIDGIAGFIIWHMEATVWVNIA